MKREKGRNKNTIFFSLLIILFSLSIASCPDVLNQNYNKYYPYAFLSQGMGSVTLSFNSSLRTVMPGNPGLNSYSHFEIDFKATSGGKDKNIKTPYSNLSSVTAAILLNEGTYTLIVRAYKFSSAPAEADYTSANAAAESDEKSITIARGQSLTETVTIKSKFSGGPNGTFKWNIIYPQFIDEQTSTVTITPLPSSVSVPTFGITGSVPLPPGEYTVTFTFNGIDNGTVKELIWNELVHVYSTLECTFTENFTQDYFHNTHHNVYFDCNNGSAASGPQSVLNGSTINLSNVPSNFTKTADVYLYENTNVPAVLGFAFSDEWHITADCSGQPWDFNSDKVHSNITLYAKWTGPIDIYSRQENTSFEKAIGYVNDKTTGAYTLFVNGDATIIQKTLNITKNLTVKSTISNKFTLTRGTAEINSSNDKIGLLVINSGAELTLENIIFDGNKGAFTNNQSSLVTVNTGGKLTMNSDAVLQNNRAVNGGGVYVDGGTFNMTGNSEIANNTATGNYSMGGGVYCSGTVTMDDSASIGSNSAVYGGGVYIVPSPSPSYRSELHMNGNSTISANTVTGTGDGGGVYYGGSGAVSYGDAFQVGGTAKVNGNFKSNNPNNVFLSNGKYITFAQFPNEPENGMNIYICTIQGSNIIVNTGATATYALYFKSDDSSKGVVFYNVNNGQLVLESYGTATNPFLVTNATLGYVGRGNLNPTGYQNWMLDKHYKQTEVITLSSNWTPIGTSTSGQQFTGTFDGNGHTITGLTISQSTDYQGMFGYIGQNGTVKNLGLVNVNISGGDYTGGITGYNNGTVQNCYVTGSVSGDNYVGGITGYNYSDRTILYCYAAGTVSGSNNVGGIAGYSNGGIVSNSISLVDSVSATTGTAAGVVGHGDGTTSVHYKNIYGWSGTTITNPNPSSSNLNGTSLSTADLKAQAAWQGSGSASFAFGTSDAAPWVWEAGKMPRLYNSAAQDWPEYIPLTTEGDINAYLESQTRGTSAADPVNLPVEIYLNDSSFGWQQLLQAIENGGKYVNLNLSRCTFMSQTTVFNPVPSIQTGKSFIVNITLPDTAESIPDGTSQLTTFNYFTSLKSFRGAGLKSIGNYAFTNCENLTSPIIPAGVKSIGDYAFINTSLTGSLILPDGLTSIGNFAFWYCTQLTGDLIIPDGITSISGGAFQRCFDLNGSLTLPSGLTSIGDSAFSECSFTGSLILPASIQSIGFSAFYNCRFSGSLTIPSGVTSIGNSAFDGCTDLTSVTFEGTVNIVGTTPFPGDLRDKYTAVNGGPGTYTRTAGDNVWTKKIVLPITNVGDIAAYLNSKPGGINENDPIDLSLALDLGDMTQSNSNWQQIFPNLSKTVILDLSACTMDNGPIFGAVPSMNKDRLIEIILPDSAESLAYGCFDTCTKLKSFIGTGIKTIGDRAFGMCYILNIISLSDELESIGSFAFDNCYGLTEIDLPATIDFISQGAFYQCSSLKTVICRKNTPPTLGYQAFYNTNSNLIIYVPAGSVGTYQTTSGWSDYAGKIQSITPP